ncbi:MAG: hypothetical protein JSU89_09625 [Myxococcales bacterium]|nr:MAG: hypothetical protein JSU89_09625 [Myxococcales bacterium]
MTTTASGISATTVTTDQQAPLGFQLLVPQAQDDATATADQGDQVWTYVFNDEAATAFAAGDIVIRDPSAATQDMYGVIQAPASTAAHAFTVVGVAQHAIAAGSYGFVLTKGRGLLRTGTQNMTEDTVCTSGGSSAGCALIYADGTIGAIEIGFSLEAEAADNTTFDAYINCLGA